MIVDYGHGKGTSIYYIDGRNRNSGNTTNFSYLIHQLPAFCDGCALIQISLVKGWYLINENNNKLIVENVEDGITLEILIPIGDYISIDVLTGAIVAAIFDAPLFININIGTNEGNPLGITTPKLYFSGDKEFKLHFENEPKNSSLSRILGFKREVYESVFDGTNDIIIAPDIYNISANDQIFIEGDIVNGSQSNESGVNVLNMLEYSAYAYGDELSKDFIFNETIIKSVNTGLTQINIKLTDEYNNIINNNGVDWNFTLMFFKKKI